MENPFEWRYGSEGNANIVLRYCGSDPSMRGKILRIRKCGSVSKSDDILDLSSAQFSVEFSEKVIAKLIGRRYIIPMKVMGLTTEFLQAVSYNIKSHRPVRRLSYDVDTRVSYGFITSDTTYRWYPESTLTIELKPKWGFLPASSYINAKNNIKKTMCRFCMHSLLRQSDIGYCPLDLYSGDCERQRKALSILLRHPEQRQLHLYLDGKSCTPYELVPFLGCTTDEYQDVLLNILLEIFRVDPILEKLKCLQRRLDELDIEGIYALCRTEELTKLAQNDLSQWERVVERFFQRLEHPICEGKIDLHQRVYEYLLSMTLKDCSLMISVKHLPSALNDGATLEFIGHDNKNLIFSYDMKVIDTDMKRMEKIPHWLELDQRIVQYINEQKYGHTCFE